VAIAVLNTAHAGDHHQRGGDGRDDRDDDLGRGGDLQAGEQAGQHDVHHGTDGGHHQHDRDHVEQAGHPANELTPELASPLVDATGQRVVRAQLGPGEGDDQLEQEDDRDRPDERRSAERQGRPGDQQRAGCRPLEGHREQ
jgi:hypothetical protein